jgi:hypothetical protein
MHVGFWLEAPKQYGTLGRSRHQGDNNIKVDPEEYDSGCRMDLSVSGQGKLVSSCKHANKPSTSIKFMTFF